MVQTSPGKSPFYFRVKTDPKYARYEKTNVETSSYNLKEIIDYYKIEVKQQKTSIKLEKNKAIKIIFQYCLSKTQEFLDKLLLINKTIERY